MTSISSKCAYAETDPYENGTIGLELTGINPVTGYKNDWGGLLTPRYDPWIADYAMQFPASTDIRYHTHMIVDSDYTHYCAVIMLDNINNCRSGYFLKIFLLYITYCNHYVIIFVIQINFLVPQV